MRKQSGFTLAEMLIALMLSALLVTLTYASLRIGIRGWESARAHADHLDELRVGWQFLHDALSRAEAVPDPRGESGQVLFEGNPQRLLFSAHQPSHLGLGGLYRIELLGDDTVGQSRLRLRRTLLFAYQHGNSHSAVQQAVLADDLARLDIRYFGQLDENKPSRWHRNWEHPQQLPRLVRIDVLLQGGQRWPTLIARPRSGQPPQPLATLPPSGNPQPEDRK